MKDSRFKIKDLSIEKRKESTEGQKKISCEYVGRGLVPRHERSWLFEN